MERQSVFNRKTALSRLAALLTFAAAAFAFQGIACAARTPHPIITATVSCSTGAPVISYTVTSSDRHSRAGSIAEVDVLFNGFRVASAPLVWSSRPANEFSGSLAAPLATATVDVQAVPAWPYVWGNGRVSSTPSATVSLTLPAGCNPGIGFFTGTGTGVDTNGNTISARFALTCDPHQRSLLEIVWGGVFFQSTGLTAVGCTQQGPPIANSPVNTIYGVEAGQVSGVDGYSAVFEVQNTGSPGANEVYFVVYQNSNPHNALVWVPMQFMGSGAVQVSYDLVTNMPTP